MRPFVPAIIWASVIFYLSVNSGIQLPDAGIPTDKINHFLAYGLLTWLILYGLRQKGNLKNKPVLLTILGTSLYGILLECVQWAFFPHRFFEFWDMIANITGVCMSYFLFRLFTAKT